METKRRGTWTSGFTLTWSLVKTDGQYEVLAFLFLLVLLHQKSATNPIPRGFWGVKFQNQKSPCKRFAVLHIFKGEPALPTAELFSPNSPHFPQVWWFFRPVFPEVYPCVASESLGRFSGQLGLLLFWDDASPKNGRIVFGHSFTDVSQLLIGSIYIYVNIYTVYTY